LPIEGEYMQASIDKQTILNVIQQLPEQTSVEDAMERLLLLTKIDKGCGDADEGRTVSHAEAEQRLEKWLR
jgi:predicted transcriptional regulator